MNGRTVVKSTTIVYSSRVSNYVESLDRIVKAMENIGIHIKQILDIEALIHDSMRDGESIPYSLFEVKGDIVTVIGGDGVVLKTFLGMDDKSTPVFAVGLGDRNFLASTSFLDLEKSLVYLAHGRFHVRREMRIDVKISGYGWRLPPLLNELSYLTSVPGKTIKPYVSIDVGSHRFLLWSFKSDGVLVSTPVGSTAYSFAAGGPVIDTDMDAIILTPLATVFKVPSYVLSPKYSVVLTSDERRAKPSIVLDGQYSLHIDWRDEVIVNRSSNDAYLISFEDNCNIRRMKDVIPNLSKEK